MPRRDFREHAGRFPCPGAISVKTRGVLLDPTRFLRTRGTFCSTRRDFRQNAWRFLCPGVISVKTRDVLPVLTRFLPKRAAFCSTWRDFRKNAGRFPCPGMISTKTRTICVSGFLWQPSQRNALLTDWERVGGSFAKQNSLSKATPCDGLGEGKPTLRK